MKPIQLISQDLFDKVRSRFTNLEMGDETGAVTIDPAEARFFDFDFVNEGVDLGRVSISLNDLGSLKIYYSQGITENQDDQGTQMWYNFLKEMRLFAMRRLLRFDTRDIAKTNLDKNDFQHLAATQGPKEEPDMNTMNETKRGLQEGRDVIATGTPDAIKLKIKELGLGPARRESTGSGGEAIFVFRNPNYYVSQGQDGNWVLVQTNAESDQQGVAEGKEDKIKQLRQDYADKLRWSKEAHDPAQQRQHRMGAGTIANHLKKQYGVDVTQGVAEGDYADGSSIKTPGSEDWKQQYQQAVMAVKNAKTQQEYEAASDRAGRIKDLLASKGIQVGAVLGQQGVAVGEHTMNESRWNHKSSSKTSRAVQGKTEVIVRHENKVAETYPGARSQRKNIKAIFIQNADGERAKYPFIHLAGAFAMAQHVDHGGVPHDPAGKAIIKMSEHIAQLGEFQRHIQRSSINSDAHGIAERAIGHMNELKAKIAALGKRHHYEAWREDFEMSGIGDNTDEMVLDAVTLEDYKSKFTQTNFQEELVGFFPLLHSIMSETNTVDLEEYVKESNEETEEGYNDSTKNESLGFAQFEEWADAKEKGGLTSDQMNNLKTAIEALPQGPQGPQLDAAIANDFFNDPEKGLTELPNFEELIQALQGEEGRDEEIRATPLQLFQSWAKEYNPDLLAPLGMTGAEEPAPAPAAPPAPEPAPEQPVAEGKSSMVQEVAKIVKSFYNADNESVGPFRAEENIALDCKKQISEKFGEKAGEQAYEMAEAFINKLTQEWQQKHGKMQKHSPVDQGDGFSVDGLKEILSRIKQKVEGIGQPEMEERDEPQDEGFVGNMIDKAKGMFGKAPAAPAPAAGNNGAHADGKPNSWMEPDMRKDFENTEISTFLLYNIRMIYRWAKEGRNIRNYIQDLKKLEHENISKPTTAAAFKFIMDNLASGEVTDPKMIMQIADKAHTLMGHSDIEQATREGVDKSQVPTFQRDKEGKPRLTLKDLEKERNQSRTTQQGLDAHAAKIGVGQKHQHESAELASIRKLAGLGEGSGPKEKSHSKYVDRDIPESQAKIQASRDKVAKDKAAEPGKALLAKKK